MECTFLAGHRVGVWDGSWSWSWGLMADAWCMLASGFIFYKPLTCQQKANAQHMCKPVGHTEWEQWMVYPKNYGVKKKCIVNCCCHYNAQGGEESGCGYKCVMSLSHRQAGWSNASSEVDISAKRNAIVAPKDAISKDALWPATTATTAAAERRAKCWQLKWQIGQTTMRQCDKNDVNRVKQNLAFSWQFPFSFPFPMPLLTTQPTKL